MIIPPDPEKDPNFFDPSASTPSLLPPPDRDRDGDDDGNVRHADLAHTRHPYGAHGYDEWSGEQLPPYERRRASSIRSGEVFGDSASMREVSQTVPSGVRSQPTLYIPHASSSRPTSVVYPSHGDPTTSRHFSASLPSLISPSATVHPDPASSSAKLWESTTTTKESRSKRRKVASLIKVSPEVKQFWRRWKRWVIGVSIVIVLGLGLMVGLLVGLKVISGGHAPHSEQTYSPWHDVDGKRTNTEWAPDGSLNLTYTPSRDGPVPGDGTPSNCNNFQPINTTDFSLLAIPYPASTQSVSSFYFAVNTTANNSGVWDEFFMISRGLGSSGTVYFVGRDSSDEVINGGIEDQIRVDVVLRYSGHQDPLTTVQVCQMDKSDGSSGIGIYTPIQTDGKVNNVYMLDPTQIPSFQIIVRFPPSLVFTNSTPLYMPSLRLSLDRMNVVFGDTTGIAEFGNVNVTTGQGGVLAQYIASENITISSASNDVKGTWNISNTLSINATDASIIANVILFSPPDVSNSTNTSASDASDGSDGSDTSTPTSASPSPSPSPSHSVSLAYKRGINLPPMPSPRVPVINGSSPFQNAMFDAAVNATPTHSVNTTFITSSGSISVNYISHPPRTALTAFIMSAQGGIDVCLNPNYVGPFAVRNVWGEVRLPPPSYQFHSQSLIDPLGLKRIRGLSTGLIDVPDNSAFARGGVNATNLPYSGTTISGGAYWYFDPNTQSNGDNKSRKWQYGSGGGQLGQGPSGAGANSTKGNGNGNGNGNGTTMGSNGTFNATITTQVTPQDVQNSPEGRGSEVMVLGAWGDVQITFDGA